MPLNQTHRSDYYFGGEDRRTRQFSRKQAGELLSNVDEAEDQLRDYYANADENYQIVEGIISPIPLTRKSRDPMAVSIRQQARPTTLFSYKVAENGFIYDEHPHDVSSSMLFAWLFQLDQAGITTYYTINWIDTARLLVAIYKNCQKPAEEHTTLFRYTRPRIYLKDRDPFVLSLIGFSHAYKIGIGEEKAKMLSAHGYTSLLDLAMAEVGELCQVEGIGRKLAENLLTALGRKL